jgi:hypothetical protein
MAAWDLDSPKQVSAIATESKLGMAECFILVLLKLDCMVFLMLNVVPVNYCFG